MLKFLFCISTLFFSIFFTFGQKPINVIPKPVKVNAIDKKFSLNPKTIIVANNTNSFEVQFLKESIKQQTGLELTTKNAHRIGSRIHLILEPESQFPNKEAYQLNILGDRIAIYASTNQGLFYGIQTLLQLIPFTTNATEIKLDNLMMDDVPKFQWRGMHLDVSRHFFSKEFIKKYIDWVPITNTQIDTGLDIILSTGPAKLTKLYYIYSLHDPHIDVNVNVLGHEHFEPVFLRSKSFDTFDPAKYEHTGAYGLHLYNNSWWDDTIKS